VVDVGSVKNLSKRRRDTVEKDLFFQLSAFRYRPNARMLIPTVGHML